jgi:hypothetical protein
MDLGYRRDWDALILWGLPVDPIGGSGVSLHLEGLDKARRDAAALNKILDLSSRHGVAFYRGGIVHIVDPDLPQDVVGFDRSRKASQVCVEEADLLVQSAEDLF